MGPTSLGALRLVAISSAMIVLFAQGNGTGRPQRGGIHKISRRIKKFYAKLASNPSDSALRVRGGSLKPPGLSHIPPGKQARGRGRRKRRGMNESESEECKDCGGRIARGFVGEVRGTCELCQPIYDSVELSKRSDLYQCRNCQRYEITRLGNDKSVWSPAKFSSHKLMNLCLKHIKNLNKVIVSDVRFVQTEETSRRIKVRIRVVRARDPNNIDRLSASKIANFTFIPDVIRQRDATESGYIRYGSKGAGSAVRIIEFKVCSKQCRECAMEESSQTGDFILQIRQHGRGSTFIPYIQHRLRATSLCNMISGIEETIHGLDITWTSRNQALRVLKFLENTFPVRLQTTRKLITHNEKINKYRLKYSYCCEIFPTCEADLVRIPAKELKLLSGQIRQPFLLCTKVTTKIYLTDPTTGKNISYFGKGLWNSGIETIKRPTSLSSFIVTSIDDKEIQESDGGFIARKVTVSALCDRERFFSAKSHISPLLKTR
ncbi:hypothetical protein AAMO2058_001329400 [Amorphochlora amoebiformis]